MQITPHFSLAELTRTTTGLGNHPTPVEIDRLRVLCVNVLEPIRAHFGRPVRVNSAFRSERVNRAVGGTPTSQHRLGEAADIEIGGVSNRDLARWIAANLDFDQVILENHDPRDPSSGWVHVSYRVKRNRNQGLTFAGGRYVTGIR